jgi:chromosome segregation ATPase
MDVNQRFDQLESLLVDLARKQDQQAEQIKQLITAVTRQEKRLDSVDQRLERVDQRLERVDQRLERIDQRLDGIGEQIGDIINIFKLSEARHTQTEQRLDELAVEIKEQGRRTDETIQVQMQMLALMRAGNEKTDDLARRLAPLEGQEPRLKRLEGEVFRAAS